MATLIQSSAVCEFSVLLYNRWGLQHLHHSQSSTASLSDSILEYRALQGRTYHSTRHATEYFTPNDNQQQESVDLTHHYFTILLDDKLFIAPIGDNVPVRGLCLFIHPWDSPLAHNAITRTFSMLAPALVRESVSQPPRLPLETNHLGQVSGPCNPIFHLHSFPCLLLTLLPVTLPTPTPPLP
jgi:hypothetical protein